MNKIPMLLKAAEYLETVNPFVIESEHDYASMTRSITPNNGSHYNVSSKIPRESRFIREPTNRREERRVRLRPRPMVEAPSTRSKVQTRSARRKRRHESPVSDGGSQHEDSTIRSIHNQAEKIRRDQMRTEIDRLKVTLLSLLPSCDYSSAAAPRLAARTSHNTAAPSISTQQTLNMALDVIKRLQAAHRSKEEEKRRLMDEQLSLEKMCKKLGRYSNNNNNIVITHLSNIHDDDDDTSFLSVGSHDGSSGCYSNRSSPDFIDVTSIASDSASLASEDSGLAMLID